MAFSVREILAWTGGRLVNGDRLSSAGEEIRVDRPSPLATSRASDCAFFFSKDYQHELPSASPGVLITGEPFVKPLEAAGLPLWNRTAVVACADPYLAMAVLSEKFAARLSTIAHVPSTKAPEGKPEIHPSAVVHETAELGAGVRIGPNCVVEERARIGAGTVLYPGCFVGPGARIGEQCVFFPGVTVYEWVEIGDRVRVHAGTVIGSDGFGYAPLRQGSTVSGHQKIYHLGRVIIGDDVEIGAVCSIDRGTMADTIIGKNSKLDNQVHVGHNARLDEGAILCGGTCLAGGASVGKYAYVGGLTGITKAHVGDGAQVGALALVTKDIPAGGTAVGNPQRDYKEHFRAHAALNRLIADRRKPSEKK